MSVFEHQPLAQNYVPLSQRYFIEHVYLSSNNTVLYYTSKFADDDYVYRFHPSEHAYIQCHSNCVGTRSKLGLTEYGVVQIAITDCQKWDLLNNKLRQYPHTLLDWS